MIYLDELQIQEVKRHLMGDCEGDEDLDHTCYRLLEVARGSSTAPHLAELIEQTLRKSEITTDIARPRDSTLINLGYFIALFEAPYPST